MRYLVILTFLGVCLFTSYATILEDKIFIFQHPKEETNKTLLVVTWLHDKEDKAVGCEIFTDPQLIGEVIKASDDDELIRKPTKQEINDIIEECTEISRRRRRDTGTFRKRSIPWRRNRENSFRRGRWIERDRNPNESLEDKIGIAVGVEIVDDNDGVTEATSTGGYNGLPVIFPGTKWCGAGDLAKNYDDLGLHQDTDRCCRAHDLCNDTLAPGETKYNLTNKSPFTKLSCQCDDDFYYCLERVNTMTSNTVGNMYFNLLKRECYAFDYPLTDKCKKYKTFLKLICVEYERDTTVEKVLQWVPAKWYKKIPLLPRLRQ